MHKLIDSFKMFLYFPNATSLSLYLFSNVFKFAYQNNLFHQRNLFQVIVVVTIPFFLDKISKMFDAVEIEGVRVCVNRPL